MKGEVHEVDYQLPQIGLIRWMLLIFFTLALTFILYFPVGNIVQEQIKLALGSNSQCPIQLNDLNINYLLPQATVASANIPRRCFGKTGAPLLIKNLDLSFRGFTLSPFGPHFKITAKYLDNPIKAYLTSGFSATKINMEDTVINLSSLQRDFPAIKLGGSLKLNLNSTISDNKISDLKLALVSKDLMITSQFLKNITLSALTDPSTGQSRVPVQMIEGTKFPSLKLNNLLILAESTSGPIQIKNIVVGDKQSPLRADFKGKILPKATDFMQSRLSLKGGFAFSPEFIQKYSFLNLLLGQYTKKDNFYQINIEGPLRKLSVNSP